MNKTGRTAYLYCRLHGFDVLQPVNFEAKKSLLVVFLLSEFVLQLVRRRFDDQIQEHTAREIIRNKKQDAQENIVYKLAPQYENGGQQNKIDHKLNHRGYLANRILRHET